MRKRRVVLELRKLEHTTIVEEIARLKAAAYWALRESGLDDAQADAVLAGRLAELPGYQGVAKIEYARQQLGDIIDHAASS